MFKNYTLNTYSDISEVEGIINFAKSVSADLVAMRTHGRTGLAHIATDSIAEDVLNHIKCPIWTYKIK
jgi:nucleotide-binding universal stress UspA family protein